MSLLVAGGILLGLGIVALHLHNGRAAQLPCNNTEIHLGVMLRGLASFVCLMAGLVCAFISGREYLQQNWPS